MVNVSCRRPGALSEWQSEPWVRVQRHTTLTPQLPCRSELSRAYHPSVAAIPTYTTRCSALHYVHVFWDDP
jgi:hypothetical protein